METPTGKRDRPHNSVFVNAKIALMGLRIRFQNRPITATLASIVLLGCVVLALASVASTVRLGVGIRGRTNVRTDDKTTNFLVVGDWGVSEDDPDRVLDVPHRKQVSHSMQQWARRIKAEMVVSTGGESAESSE
jgi:hypothetical protein